MSFAAPRPLTVRWRPEHGDGLEHLTLRPEAGDQPEAGRIVARGVLIGGRAGRPYGVDYATASAGGWAVRRFDLATTDGMALSVESDGAGTWRNHDGRALPEFDGCLDVGLAGSAFTNTLPIRRVAWGPGRRDADLAVLYVPFDTFVPVRDGQRYRALEGGRDAADGQRRFRYEAADRGFAAELTVDADGLVLEYPGLFRRA